MPIAIPSKRSQSYTRQSSRSSTASSTGSGSLAASGSVAGSSSFLVGRQRERLAEMELFRYFLLFFLTKKLFLKKKRSLDAKFEMSKLFYTLRFDEVKVEVKKCRYCLSQTFWTQKRVWDTNFEIT